MNLIEEFKKGQEGGNKGLYMGDGLVNISNYINGIQKGRIFGVVAPPKVGKSTFTDYGFVIQPYLHSLKDNLEVEWIYFSFELDRVSKEFDYATYFLYHDFGIEFITLDEGVTKDKKNIIELSPNYLRGRMLDDDGNVIKVKPEIIEALKVVYENRIIPMFGEYASNGSQVTPGKINFIEQKDNPTGIYKFLKDHASKEGTFIKSGHGEFQRIVGYRPRNPNKYTIIIIDHLRKLIPERGWQMKQTVDKMLEYQVEIRNWCNYSFVPIIHTNRNISSVDRIKYSGQDLYPTSEDIKDSGNLAEDADYVFTLFNPNDTRYNLKEHFGLKIKDTKNNEFYPNLRTIHLVESRHCDFPKHFKVNMFGNYKSFNTINIK